jgi:hypothetical protein
MDEAKFFTEIAFIPWNYHRTASKIVELFNERRDRYSLCVHGCDHVGSEFGIFDFNELNRKIKRATQRMDHLQRTTGLKFDDVMVFPQGLFSEEAIEAIKCNNYLACVNSVFTSTDNDRAVRISDFLDMAIMSYSGFPIFYRRYPDKDNLLNYAFDLFIGKPILIVGHHDLFRNGYDNIVNFIRTINSLDRNIQWGSLREIIENSYLEKNLEDGKICVKIFGRRCVIRNSSNDYRKIIVLRREFGRIPVEKFDVNGKPGHYSIKDGLLRSEIELQPKGTAYIELLYKDYMPQIGIEQSFRDKSFAAARRILSEIRDEILCKDPRLLSMANSLIRAFKRVSPE